MPAVDCAASSAPFPLLYSCLGIGPDATGAEIRAAYLKLVKLCHPDRASSEQKDEATRKFRALAQAYVTLSDAVRRKAYDLALERHSAASLPLSTSPPTPHLGSISSGVQSRAPRSPVALSPDAPESPFPGYRVPPGGYPRCLQTVSSFPDFGVYFDPEPSIQQSHCPAELIAFGGDCDWPNDLQAPLAEMHELALRETGYPDSHLALRYRHDRHGGSGLEQEKCKTARKEWTEAKVESNGDRTTKAGRYEVTHCRNGTTSWRSETTTIISHAQNHYCRPKPPPPIHSPSPHHHHHHHHHRNACLPVQKHDYRGRPLNGHRSHSLPPLGAPSSLLGLPSPAAHIPLRSPGKDVLGAARFYKSRDGDLRRAQVHEEHKHKHRVHPTPAHGFRLSGAWPGGK